MNRGRYIVIEGGEGVGKSTQTELLISRLIENGIEAVYMQEPGSTPFATELRKIIKHGPARTAKANVLTFNAARAETVEQIEQALSEGKWVVADRSFLSTICYQGYGEGQDIEAIRSICDYAVGQTRPGLIVILEVSPEVAADRLGARAKGGDYFEDMESQFHDRLREGYRQEAARDGYPLVNGEGEREEVLERVWKHVEPLIAGGEAPAEAANAYLTKHESGYLITSAGRQELGKFVTNTTDDVYAFNGTLDPVTVAAAMARLSRRGDDMRVTLLDEFIGQQGKDEDLLRRVITAYGDDSVQQLAGMHLVVENASNLLTKKLEWGRLASYLEQSTRYIYFDQRDAGGRYRYYLPSSFDRETAAIYTDTMDGLFDSYSRLVRALTNHVQQESTVPADERDGAWRAACRAQACDAARPLLPAATRSTVGIFGSGQAVESLIMHLLSDELSEARTVGGQILAEARKVMVAFLERADKPDRGGAMIAYRAETRRRVRELATNQLPAHSGQFEPVTLIGVSMRNELDLVPYMLYESSALSIEELKNEVDNWPVNKKIEAFWTYMGERLNRRHKPGRALEHVDYTWDIVCDYGIFRDLHRHRIVDAMEWQDLTPRYGYEIPQLVDDAGMSEIFENCFERSLELYNELVQRGYAAEAQYATLLGHRMRWKFKYNARAAFHIHELRTAPQGHPGYRKLVNAMHARMAEVHPMLAEAMKFVNQGEDPELTRLAAERYTQYKLTELDKQTKG
jgi:dTMP kinase